MGQTASSPAGTATMNSQPPGISSKASTLAISSPPASDKVQAAPTSSGNLSAQASTARLAALSTSASATAGEDPQNMSLIRRLSISADETTSKMSRKLSSMAEEGRQALRRNNTVVSMASTGVHVITDAGIHLPHELHVPNIGLSHPANATLGAITAAVVAGSLVSPMITVLDLAIVRSQFDHIGVGTAVKRTASDLYTGRASWNPALRIMGGVYLSTYMAANGTEAWCTENGIDYKIPTAVTTSLVNIVGVSLKDRAFARMMKKSASSFPLSSYLLFGIRDGMTVTSTFVLKNTVRDHLVEDLSFRPRYADIAASFAVPMLAQIPFTPLHILAMDLYVRKDATWLSRLQEIKSGYRNVLLGRVMRIVPAFGVGGVVNDMVKEAFEDEEEAMFLHMDRGPPVSKR
ncbi:hypothetical protein Naga_100266g4 [Nannochloropsis gaditana]|uniref:Uncharacterized protein n=1 Tax=Nannochloropsis gaditana TaxID=72520 RepID=W7TTD2_9STRA|nr:hypothetical protein Naga_100266g4 [Nannochloropsis gaditana]